MINHLDTVHTYKSDKNMIAIRIFDMISMIIRLLFFNLLKCLKECAFIPYLVIIYDR